MAYWASTTNWASKSSDSYRSEPDLVRAAQQGDREAFQQLILCYDRLVLSLALNVTQSEEDAKEIYERVFLRAFRSLPAKDGQQSLFLWIYRIAAECCREFLSRHNELTDKVSLRRHSHRSLAAGSESYRGHLSPRACCFSQLSVKERLVFAMTHYGHLRAETVAEILSSSEISVKEALIRAVYKLRNAGQTAA